MYVCIAGVRQQQRQVEAAGGRGGRSTQRQAGPGLREGHAARKAHHIRGAGPHHSYIHTYIHTLIQVYIHTYIHGRYEFLLMNIHTQLAELKRKLSTSVYKGMYGLFIHV